MKPQEKQKKFVRETLLELQYAMYLTEWNIDIAYRFEDSVEKPGVAAEMTPSHLYFDTEITIYPLFFSRSVSEQRGILVHEMCHIYTEPYKEMWERMHKGLFVGKEEEAIINERMTTMIERIATDAFKERLGKIVIDKPTKKKRKGVK